MSNVTFKKTYETNLQLEALYETLDALEDKYHHKYPDEINNEIKKLLSKISNYIYDTPKGYDVIAEHSFSKITFSKN